MGVGHISSNWDAVHPLVPFAYKRRVQSTTGLSEFCILYGREAFSMPVTILPSLCDATADALFGEPSTGAGISRQLPGARTTQHQSTAILRYDIPTKVSNIYLVTS